MSQGIVCVSVPSVAENIREARKAVGLSQEAFAELVGTSRRNVMRWEGGYNNPGRYYIGRIANVTGQAHESFAADLEDENEAMQVLEVRVEELLEKRGVA
jgi:transcriptional regulator with XRE-family HTH domain